MSTQGQDTHTILERLERLERQQRRWRYVGLLGYALAGIVLLGGPAVSQNNKRKVVTAEQFELVDSNGELRGALSLYKDGPALLFWDAAGKRRGAL